MRLLMTIAYLFWPAMAWGVWFGMNQFGYKGWGMDLLYIWAIVLTVVMAGIAIAANLIFSKM